MNDINNYLNGRRHGLTQVCYLNKNICFKAYFINGKQHGSCEEYYSDGKLKYKGNYNMNKLDGYWEFYDQFGDFIKSVFYAR
jgi:antitoxin component YwqK of YwqJK toxin-antitoxin module